ncbi:MAG: hypothetical protein AAF266_06170 [Planctomycetota bacterium]
MSQTLRAGFVAAFAFVAVVSAKADTMNWGDLADPMGDVMFLQVSEDSGVGEPLRFGAPTAAGNQLIYSPNSFQSQSSGGGADLVDSTVTTTIMANQNEVINNIQFSEFGDYTLSGLNGGQAQATVGAAFFYTVEEIDGVPVTMMTETASMQFTTGSGVNGGEYNRSVDDGTAIPWTGTVLIDLDAYLAGEGIDGSVTKVRLRFDNTLSTAADSVSNAFIKKKEVGGVIITTNIPEPASALLVVLATAATFAARRQN